MKDTDELDIQRTLISLTILGESSVGKTQLTLVYTGKDFEQNDLLTVGYDIQTKQLTLSNGITVKLKIWDTAGQERFRNMAAQYVKNTNGILFVYDISRRVTFEKINDWIQLAKSKINLSTIPFCIVGNKCDLENEREVSVDEGNEFAKSLSVPFFETSAKTGDCVHETFNDIANRAYEHFKDEFNNNPNGSIKLDKTKLIKKKKGCCGREKKDE